MIKKENYQKSLNTIPRLLSMLDKNPCSPRYGCFDRNYWHYKAIVDFPSATYQQGALTLAQLYKSDFEGNVYYKNEDILNFVSAGIDFWTRIQNRDGSFNEWFPNEHSYVATAFTTYGITESLLLVGEEIKRKSEDIFNRSMKAVRKSTSWLAIHEDKWLANHIAGAALALYNVFLLTNEDYFRVEAEKKINHLLKFQDEEGWFSEYQGVDIGYLNVTVDFLAKYYSKSNNIKLKPVLGKALNFLRYFIHPDGTSGGEYGTRNTKYLLPKGLEILKKENAIAFEILSKFHKGLSRFGVLEPSLIDDRYFVFFFLPNYIQALSGFEDVEGRVPEGQFFSRHFPNAGLISHKHKNFHLILNYKKNGVMKIFNNSNGELIYDDSGYFGTLENKKMLTSQWFNEIQKTSFREQSDCIELEFTGKFAYAKTQTPLHKLLIVFRLFNWTFGRSDFIMRFFNNILKSKIILENRPAPMEMKKKVIIKDNEVYVDELIQKDANLKLQEFNKLKNISLLHVPTSNYYLPGESKALQIDLDKMKDILNRKNRVSVFSRFSWKDNKFSAEIEAL